jgi:hypothetical protein
MNPALHAYLADSILVDRVRDAARRAPRRPDPVGKPIYDGVTVRRARADDLPAIRRLAELEGSRVPSEPMLVADVDGAIVVARSLERRQTLADPFRPTSELVELLDLRALHLRGEPESPRHPRIRRFARAVTAPIRS